METAFSWGLERNPNDPCEPFLDKWEGNEAKCIENSNGVFAVERRRYPRYSIEFPLIYSVMEEKPDSRWGLATDVGEGGILVYLRERIKIGAILKIETFYPGKLAFTKISATAKLVWSGLAANGRFGKHRYGLQFESIPKGDLNKLRILLRKSRNIVKITDLWVS